MSTTTPTFLYKRPRHSILNVVERDKDTGTVIPKGQQAISAFAGIDLAVRGVSMNNGQLVECLRISRKLDKAGHREPLLHQEYVEFTDAERKIIEHSVLNFNWSKHATEIGHNLWVSWTAFLEGFDPESDIYASTWTAYDPKNPSVEYVEAKQRHAALLEQYNTEVAKAEAEALAKKNKPAEAAPEVVEAEIVGYEPETQG